jgi:hypothetical protein
MVGSPSTTRLDTRGTAHSRRLIYHRTSIFNVIQPFWFRIPQPVRRFYAQVYASTVSAVATVSGDVDGYLCSGCDYCAADAFLLLPLIEGFGLPAFEATSYRTRVVCSEIPALHEMAEGAVRLVNPHSPSAVAIALIDALRDPDLAYRDRARELVNQLTWKQCARGVWASVAKTAAA